MSQKPGKEYIAKYHLYYALVIFLIIIVSIFSFNFGGGEKAGNMLGFAATLSSILLAFIAILMTIVDLAGQRNTVAELKETADKLEGNLTTTNEGITEIGNLKEELMSSMESIIKSNLEMSKEIVSLKEKYSIDETSGDDKKSTKNSDILKDLENLNDRMSSFHINNMTRKYEESKRHALEDRKVSAYIRITLSRELERGKDYELDHIYTIFTNKKTKVSRSRLKHELNKLVKSGNLERINDKYYRIIKI